MTTCCCGHQEHASYEPRVCKNLECHCIEFRAESPYLKFLSNVDIYIEKFKTAEEVMEWILINLPFFRNYSNFNLVLAYWKYILHYDMETEFLSPDIRKVLEAKGQMDNTIDGTGAFSISPFTLREWCTNGCTHAQSVMEITNLVIKELITQKSDTMQAQLDRLEKESKNFDDQISDVKKIRIRHDKKFPAEIIGDYLRGLKVSLDSLKKRYSEMLDLKVSQEQAAKLARLMPVRLTETLDWLDTKAVKDSRGRKIGQTGKLSKAVDQWKAFNDITYELSHNKDRAYMSSKWTYKQLDKILVRSKK